MVILACSGIQAMRYWRSRPAFDCGKEHPMWRASGMRNEYQVVEKEGRFYVVRVLARTGEEPRQFYVSHRGTGRLICFAERATAVWYCETAANEGEAEAYAQARARFEFKDVPRPPEIQKELREFYGLPDTSDQE